jgi:hypothetical protein
MNTFICALLISTSFVHAANTKKEVKMDIDQVWTFSFEELDMIPQIEKEEFSRNLVKEAASNEVLKKIKETTSEDKFKTVWSSEEKWDSFETKIKSFCEDTKNYAACIKIGDVRVNLLNKYSNRK